MRRVANKGDTARERLILDVTGATDVGEYALLQTGARDGEVTIGVHHTYWFPNKVVAAGDLVVLYTKDGQDKETVMEDGRKTHFFYWGLPSPIWLEPERAAVLLNAPTWTTLRANSK